MLSRNSLGLTLQLCIYFRTFSYFEWACTYIFADCSQQRRCFQGETWRPIKKMFFCVSLQVWTKLLRNLTVWESKSKGWSCPKKVNYILYIYLYVMPLTPTCTTLTFVSFEKGWSQHTNYLGLCPNTRD